MEKDVGILSLVGMGGIGKTTLAKELYYSFEKDTFEKKSILMNVRESAILDLQKQLARDLFKEDVRGTQEFNRCFNRVMDRKVLIVIDDVDQKCQFDQLIPDIKKLCPGSRVIITSPDSNVVNQLLAHDQLLQVKETDSDDVLQCRTLLGKLPHDAAGEHKKGAS